MLRVTLLSASFLAALLGVQPVAAGAQVSVLGSTQQEAQVTRGQRYSGSFTLLNDSEQEQNVRIYQTDYRFFADGRSPFDAPGSHSRSNASWVEPAVSTIRIAPRSQAVIQYDVRVPDDSSLAGTYWSVVMVEAMRDPRATGRRGVVGVGSTVRYAVQVISHLEDPGTRAVSLRGIELLADSSGTPHIEVDVENDGASAYRPLLWLEVYDQQGTLRAKLQQQRGLLLPGCSLRQVFALDRLSRGAYKVVLFADVGDESVTASEFMLEI